MNVHTQGSAPRAGMLRVMNPRRSVRTNLIFAAVVTGGTVLLTTSSGFAQSIQAPPAFVEQLRQQLGSDNDPMTPVLTQDCNPAEGYTCITVQDSVLVPLSCQVANNATPEQVEYVRVESYRRGMRHMAHVTRVLRRDLDAEIAQRVALGHTVNTVSLIQRTALGCTADMDDQACLVQSANYHTYWYEVEPALRAARDAVVDEADAEMRTNLTSIHNDVSALNTRYDELRTGLTAEVAAREALGRRVDGIEERLSRHTLGFAAVGEAELLGGHGMYGATVRVMWRTGGFAASAQGGGFWNSTLEAGTFVAGADAGAAINVGDSMRVDLGGYARTMQLPEDQLGERSGRIVRSAGSLFFEAGAFGRWFSNRRGASVLVEARLGLADPPGDSDVGVVAAIAVGAAANLGL